MDRHGLIQIRDQVDELLRHGSPSCVREANSIMVKSFRNVLHFALELIEPKPKIKHTIVDNFPAGGLTATEPCMFCKDFEKLQDELDRYYWIPVSERLPVLEEGITQSPWVDITDGKCVTQAYYYDYTRRKATLNSATGKGWYCPGMSQESITHWKPIYLPKQTPEET